MGESAGAAGGPPRGWVLEQVWRRKTETSWQNNAKHLVLEFNSLKNNITESYSFHYSVCVWRKIQIPRVIHREKRQFFKSLCEPKSRSGSEIRHGRETAFLFCLFFQYARAEPGDGTDKGPAPPAVCLALSVLSSMNGRNLSYYRTGSAKLIHSTGVFHERRWALDQAAEDKEGFKYEQNSTNAEHLFPNSCQVFDASI